MRRGAPVHVISALQLKFFRESEGEGNSRGTLDTIQANHHEQRFEGESWPC